MSSIEETLTDAGRSTANCRSGHGDFGKGHSEQAAQNCRLRKCDVFVIRLLARDRNCSDAEGVSISSR